MVYGIVCVLWVLRNMLSDDVLPIPDQSSILSLGRLISRRHHIVAFFVFHSGCCSSDKLHVLADIFYFKPNLTKRKDQTKQ